MTDHRARLSAASPETMNGGMGSDNFASAVAASRRAHDAYMNRYYRAKETTSLPLMRSAYGPSRRLRQALEAPSYGFGKATPLE